VVDEKSLILLSTAASLGFIHTLIGTDHYLPFVMMSRAGNWRLRKTLIVTVLCGIGHVLSSIVLGAIGVAAGLAVARLEGVESRRGEIASWALIGFGILYALWGLHRARKGHRHTHAHLHPPGHEHDGPPGEHDHEHAHTDGHAHVHTKPGAPSMTPWVLFVVFVLGPCEPLIPLVMYPAAERNTALVVGVSALFGLVTIATMTTMVLVGSLGLSRLRLGFAERYMHFTAGAVIALSGLAIMFLGL